MATSRESDGKGMSPVSEREQDSPNLFAAFVDKHQQQFLEYRSLAKECRMTEKAWRQAFQPLKQEHIDRMVKNPGTNPKMIDQTHMSTYEQIAFTIFPGEYDYDDEIDDDLSEQPREKKDRGQYFADAVRKRKGLSMPLGQLSDALGGTSSDTIGLISEWNSIVLGFNRDFNLAMSAPMDNFRTVKEDLTDKVLEVFLSNYGAMADALNLLSDPHRGREKDIIAAFFRDFGKEDSDARRTKPGSGLTARLREEWQKRLRESFNPIVFERFLNSISDPSKSDDLEMLKFGALLARTQRDEEGVDSPTAHEIGVLISRISMDLWPKHLRDSYTAFAIKDAAIVIEAIRTKMLELFPKSVERPAVYAPTKKTSFFSKRRNHREDSNHTEKSCESYSNGNGEGNGQAFKLSMLKANSTSSTATDYMITIDPEHEEEEITRLANAGSSPQMKIDFANILKSMKDPLVVYGPASKKLGRNAHVQIDGKSIPLRRIDPRKIKGLSLQDPASMQARIVFAISDDNFVMIKGIYSTHKEYEDSLGYRKS